MNGIRRHTAGAVGFIGLGLMGSAMAANLHKKTALVVWNRTPAACAPFAAAGAEVAPSAASVFEKTRIVFVMLADEDAIDTVVRTDGTVPLQDRIVVLMSTVSPRFSEGFGRRIEGAGARYVEAPVSGSRQPARDATLISMLAGDPAAIEEVEPFVRAMCSTAIRCGRPASALTTKLAVNTFLIALVTGLAESFHFAESNGVDPETLRMVLDAGPMASAVSRAKAAKLITEDWEPHAAIHDVLKNSRLVSDQARHTGNAAPLMDICVDLYAETEALGYADHDMAAVIHALRHRTHDAKQAAESGRRRRRVEPG